MSACAMHTPAYAGLTLCLAHMIAAQQDVHRTRCVQYAFVQHGVGLSRFPLPWEEAACPAACQGEACCQYAGKWAPAACLPGHQGHRNTWERTHQDRGFTPEYQPADSTAFKSHPQQLTHLQRGSQLMEPGQGALCWLGCTPRHPSHATLGDREPLPAAAEPPQRLHIVTLVPAQWGCCAGSSATTCNC